MSATLIVSRPARFSPMADVIPAHLTEALATRIALTRGLIGRGGHIAALTLSTQHTLREDARQAIQLAARGPAETVLINLRRTLANQLFGGMTAVKFDQLTLDERHEVADLALVAWQTMLDVLAGIAPAIPDWELKCLTFSGPYDPALLTTTKETVQ